MTLTKIKPWLVARLKEKTTWQGISVLGGLLGLALDVDKLMAIGLGVAAVLDIAIPEKPTVVVAEKVVLPNVQNGQTVNEDNRLQ